MSKVSYQVREVCPLGPHEAGSPLQRFATVDDPATGLQFEVLKCLDCGVGLTTPFPTVETLPFLYSGRESVGNFDPIRGTIMDRLKDAAARRDLSRVVPRSSRERIRAVLDFGTGNGRFALVAATLCPSGIIDAVDFERDPPPALCGHPRIRYRTVEQMATSTTRYDVILLRHVLEHVHDPVALLVDMARRLADKGLLYLEVPNVESAYARLFAERTNALVVPFHLFHFSARSLSLVIKRAGLAGRVCEKEMPLMNGVLANLFGQERALVHQLLGVVLQPLQFMAGLFLGKPCLYAVCEQE